MITVIREVLKIKLCSSLRVRKASRIVFSLKHCETALRLRLYVGGKIETFKKMTALYQKDRKLRALKPSARTVFHLPPRFNTKKQDGATLFEFVARRKIGGTCN